jgi:hypothetical protein
LNLTNFFKIILTKDKRIPFKIYPDANEFLAFLMLKYFLRQTAWLNQNFTT